MIFETVEILVVLFMLGWASCGLTHILAKQRKRLEFLGYFSLPLFALPVSACCFYVAYDVYLDRTSKDGLHGADLIGFIGVIVFGVGMLIMATLYPFVVNEIKKKQLQKNGQQEDEAA